MQKLVKLIIILIINVWILCFSAMTQISLIPNPSVSDSGFVGNPIIFNNNLYFQSKYMTKIVEI